MDAKIVMLVKINKVIHKINLWFILPSSDSWPFAFNWSRKLWNSSDAGKDLKKKITKISLNQIVQSLFAFYAICFHWQSFYFPTSILNTIKYYYYYHI